MLYRPRYLHEKKTRHVYSSPLLIFFLFFSHQIAFNSRATQQRKFQSTTLPRTVRCSIRAYATFQPFFRLQRRDQIFKNLYEIFAAGYPARSLWVPVPSQRSEMKLFYTVADIAKCFVVSRGVFDVEYRVCSSRVPMRDFTAA